MSLSLSEIIVVFRQVVVVLLVTMVMLSRCSSGSKCEFKAIFNFGDSNSDTGGFWAAFPAQSGPFGMTYFKRPAGRATDGRLMVDFLGKTLITFPLKLLFIVLTDKAFISSSFLDVKSVSLPPRSINVSSIITKF